MAKGPHLTIGYWNDAKATADAFGEQGWFRTGDVGCFDADGALILRGRLKEMIKSGGENIYPTEIETLLIEHPAIVDVAVVGIPDMRFGEVLCANIVLKGNIHWTSSSPIDLSALSSPSHCLSPAELQQYCRDHGLTHFKVPKIFVAQRSPLPRLASGKLQREAIRRTVRHVTSSESVVVQTDARAKL